MPNSVSVVPSTTSSTFSCPLCCEDKPDGCVLSTCGHKSCRDCCVKWIEKAEVAGQVSLPHCPWCRVCMTAGEVELFLGRAFSPQTARGASLQEQELDDLTRQLLESETTPCPGCGARISKVEGGCDLMECLCGYRFCYNCGSQDAQCSCTPSHHYFWDNVLDRAAQRTAGPRAATNADTGIVDLRKHIKERLKTEKAKQTRAQRQNRRHQLQMEAAALDIPTSSAIWLFHSNPSNSLRILSQIVQIGAKSQTRRMVRRRDDGELFGGKWLFECKGKGLKWLNFITSNNLGTVRRKRRQQKIAVLKERATCKSLAAPWLYNARTNASSFQILSECVSIRAQTQQQIRKTRERESKRRRQTRKQESTRQKGAHLAIANGSWLYQRKSPQKTSLQLSRLYQQCNQRDPSDWMSRGASIRLSSRTNKYQAFHQEQQNLENIRRLFPGEDKEQGVEEQTQQQPQQDTTTAFASMPLLTVEDRIWISNLQRRE